MAKDFLKLTATNPFGQGPRRRRLGSVSRRLGSVSRRLEETPGQRIAVWAAQLLRRDWARVGLALITVLALTALLSLRLLPDRVSLRAGEVSGQDVRAQRSVRYLDEDTTAVLRNTAVARTEPVYSAAHTASEADEAISEAFLRLRRNQGQTDPVRAAQEVRREVGLILPPAALAPLLKADAGAFHLDQAERLTRQAVHTALDREIRDDHPGDLAEARAVAAARLSNSLLPRTHLPVAEAIARAVIQPNRLLDRARTQAARQAAARLVTPVYGQVFAGDTVVRGGQVVTPGMIDKLRALGLQNPRVEPQTVACILGLVACMTGLMCLWLARDYAAIFRSTKTMLLLALLVTLGVLGLRLGSAALGMRLSTTQFGYVGMVWVAAMGMLIAALIQPRIALLVTALLAVQSGVVLGGDLRFSVLTLLATWVGIFAVADIRSRSDVLRAAGLLCAANVVLSLLVGQLQGDSRTDLGQSVVWAAVSGLLSVAVFTVSAPLFERLFGLTSHLGLLELSDPNRPLLKRFCELAPGTYTHSVLVGNLAVAGAEAISADALLCRVGALYHDLGKMERAQFFVENQAGGDNAHDRLNPSLSALVVTAHVRDGLAIAEREKLPPVVKQFITEHHGTSLIRYFFHQQCLGDDGTDHCREAAPGLETQFRYAGPKPQTRETAILMLADSVEAASKTLDKPTLGRIEDLVTKIMDAQLADGQLDECDLTQRDLRGLHGAFCRLLSGMLHSRIDYPDTKKTDAHTLIAAPDGLVSVAGRAAGADRPADGSAAA